MFPEAHPPPEEGSWEVTLIGWDQSPGAAKLGGWAGQLAGSPGQLTQAMPTGLHPYTAFLHQGLCAAGSDQVREDTSHCRLLASAAHPALPAHWVLRGEGHRTHVLIPISGTEISSTTKPGLTAAKGPSHLWTQLLLWGQEAPALKGGGQASWGALGP